MTIQNNKPQKTAGKQQEKSARTKKALIQATIDLMVERGFANLNVSDIAARAGVSSGARVHHFSSKNDLLLAAVEHSYNESIANASESVKKLRAKQNIIKALFANLQDLYFNPFFLSALELILAKRMDTELTPKLHKVIERYHNSIRDVWCDAICEQGYATQDAIAIYSIVLDAVRGMTLTRTWRHDQKQIDLQVRRLTKLLANSYSPQKEPA